MANSNYVVAEIDSDLRSQVLGLEPLGAADGESALVAVLMLES